MTTLIPAATKTLPEVVGKAIYIELSPVLDSEGNTRVWQGKNSTTQIFITPSGTDSSGKKVQAVMYDRVVSKDFPRSQWTSNQLQPLKNDSDLIKHFESEPNGRYLSNPEIEDFESLPDSIKNDLYANSIAQKLRGLAIRSSSKFNEETKEYDFTHEEVWTLSKKFAVEVTDEDLVAIGSWKTPQAIVRRINKVRDLA